MKNKDKILTNHFFVFLAMLTVSVIWGSAYSTVKVGYRLLEVDTANIPSLMLFAGYRYILAGILLFVFGFFTNKDELVLNSKKIKSISINTLFQVLGQYAFYYIGLVNTSGTTTPIINSTSIFFAIFLASFVFKTEKYTLWKFLSSVLAITSVFILNYKKGDGFAIKFFGEGFILISSFLAAIATCLQRPLTKVVPPVPLCGYSFFFGGVIFTLYGLIFGGSLTIANFPSICLLIYVAFISAYAFSVQAILLKYNDVSLVSIYRVMMPIFGVFISAIVLKELDILVKRSTLIALFLMVCAILILSLGKEKKEEEKTKELS